MEECDICEKKLGIDATYSLGMDLAWILCDDCFAKLGGYEVMNMEEKEWMKY